MEKQKLFKFEYESNEKYWKKGIQRKSGI